MPRHKAGHKVPREAKASFLGDGFEAFYSQSSLEAARQGLSRARKPGSELSLAEPEQTSPP